MDKVKITQEQAELLDEILTTTNVALILQLLADWKNVVKSTNDMCNLHIWYIADTLKVSKALIIGYEVEETPEDKVREYYNKHLGWIQQARDANDEKREESLVFAKIAIEETVFLLGIKIEGVNA